MRAAERSQAAARSPGALTRKERARSAAGSTRGRFQKPTVRLREQADNSFLVTIHTAPNALRKVRFSTICVDCLAAGPPPASD